MNRPPDERHDETPLAETADLPRSIEPGRDLWPDIATEIGAEGRRDRGERRDARVVVGRFDRWRRPLLAAAAVLLIFLAGYGLGQVGRRAAAPPLALDDGTPAETVLAGTSPFLPAATSDSLLAALAARQDELDPETLEVLRRNLEIIDGAVRQIRGALEEDPENPRLQEMLYAEERRRGNVLSRAADLLKVI